MSAPQQPREARAPQQPAPLKPPCGAANVTSVSLAGAIEQPPPSRADAMRAAFERADAQRPNAAPARQPQEERLSAKLLGKLGEREAQEAIALPRGGNLPKMDAALRDRYETARRNVLMLGAIAERSAAGASAGASAAASTRRARSRLTSRLPSRRQRQPSARAAAGSSDGGAGGGAAAAAEPPGVASTARAGAAEGGWKMREGIDEADEEEARTGRGAGGSTAGGSAPGGGQAVRALRKTDSYASRFSEAASTVPGSVAAAPHRRPLRHVGSGRSALSAATSAAASGAGAPHARRYRRADASLGHRSAISDASAGTLMTNTESLGSRYTAANSSVTGGGGRFGGASRSSAGGGAAHGRRRGRAGGGRAAPPKPQPGPVARAVMEWGGRDDWISRALLRHALATAIQARWRGFITRKKLRECPDAFFADLAARAEARGAEQCARAALVRELQRRRARAGATGGGGGMGGTGAPAAGGGGAPGGAAGGGGRLNAAASFKTALFGAKRLHSAAGSAAGAHESEGQRGGGGGGAVIGADDDDDDPAWLDVELDDVAVVKFRASTPPWQQLAAANGSKWSVRSGVGGKEAGRGYGASVRGGGGGAGGGAPGRLQQLRARRWARLPALVALSPGAAAAARAEGGAWGGGGGGAASAGAGGAEALVDPSEAPIPRDVIDGILLPRYAERYEKLGVPEKAPGRRRMQQMPLGERSPSPALLGRAAGAGAAGGGGAAAGRGASGVAGAAAGAAGEQRQDGGVAGDVGAAAAAAGGGLVA